MMNLFGGMYLRPGNLWKSFRIKRLKTENQNGYPTEIYVDSQDDVKGIVSLATDNSNERMKTLFDQASHSITHQMVVIGKPDLRKGDMLIGDDIAYLVLIVDDVGLLGRTGLIYLEERNDIKK
jgi:hypothetical protein